MSIRELTPALRQRAEIELNEKPTSTASDIAALREWLSKQPHLKAVTPSDQWLVAFLRGCKFSLERSKQKLDTYYTLRSIAPDLFADRDVLSPNIQEMLKQGVYLPLRGCVTEDGGRLCLIRLGAHDPGRCHLAELIKLSLMISEILMLEDDNFVVGGQDIILDLKGVSLSLVAQFSPGLARKVTTCMEQALPVRQRSNHMLHTPPGFEAAFTLFKSFISTKLKKRILVHNLDYEALYKHVPKRCLPREYGGEDGSLQDLTDHWKAKVESYAWCFRQEERQRSDESRRLGQADLSQELFGTDGSFRKLDID